MKRTFFDPHSGQVVTTDSMKMPQRHARFGAAAYKSDGGKGEDDDEDDTLVAEKRLLGKIKKNVETLLQERGIGEKEGLEGAVQKHLETLAGVKVEALRTLADAENGAMAKIVAMGTELEALKTQGFGKREDMSVRAQVLAWRETNKVAIASIATGHKAELKPLEIRTASPMTPANTYNGSAYIPRPEFEAGVIDIVRPEPTFWDYIRKGRSSSETYVWVNKKNALGTAGFIAPGVLKPGISFELDTEVSHAKKIAASLKTAIELLQDVDGMVDFIENELRYAVMHEVNAKLMSGTASSTVPAGIQSLSVPFTATGLYAANANNMDAIRAAVAQIRSGNLKGPVTAFVHPIDLANMDMQKATDSGVYLLPPFATSDGKTIGGATIVEDNNVTQGYIQVALLDYYKVKIYKDYYVTWGWENDDFTKNLVTAIGEMRLHQFFSENHTGAFVYDTFTNIKTAISTPV